MTEIKLPKIDENIDQSMVIFWHKQEGDSVEEGDVLVEVQTEKVVTEIEAEQSGILKEIVIKRGDVASVGDVLCIIGEAEAEEEAAESSDKAEAKVQKEEQKERTFVRVAPRLRRLARDLDVDLVELQKAREGAITEQAIRDFAEAGTKPEGESLTGIRKTIADRMLTSLQNSAQLTETAYADVTDLSTLRDQDDEKISWNSWILRAVVKALEKNPYMNGSFEEGVWYEGENIHLGVAVDTEDGLIVPVVKEAEQYNLVDLNDKVAELVDLVREKKLTADRMTGSSFTVTNLGGFGVHFFTPIINPPEVGILGLGEIEKFLVLDDGDVKERLRLPLSLTFDHQVIDGAPAARFLQSLIDLLENPEQLK